MPSQPLKKSWEIGPRTLLGSRSTGALLAANLTIGATMWPAAPREPNFPLQRSSPEVKVLLLAHIAAVTALQLMKDDRGQDGDAAEDQERLMDATNHCI